MRVFDLIGATIVVAWLGIVGMFVYDLNFAESAEDLNSSVVFSEGESWMILTRESAEVGYIHEARTKLDDDGNQNWLLEYDLLINVSMLGIDQYLRTEIKAHVDKDAYLQKFNAEIRTAGTSFELTGLVKGNDVVMSMDLGGQLREERIPLQQPPRLSNSALNQLVATEELRPGTKFEQEYFDPTTMGMTKMTFEFVREHEVEVYEERIPTLHFRQLVAGAELDVFVHRNGEVYIQEFPLRILGARVPPELGIARAKSLQRRFESENKRGGGEVDLSVATAVGLIKGAQQLDSIGTHRYLIDNIPENATLELDSAEQRASEKKGASAIVDTSVRALQRPAEQVNLEPFLAHTMRIDADADAFNLLKDGGPGSATAKAESLARAIGDKMTVKGEVGIQTASAALARGEGDCTEFALVLVAALRRYEIPARFVSGVKRDEDGHFIPHQWVQYHNGSEFVDLDPTTDTMLPGNGQIQFYTHAEPEKPELVHLLSQIEIKPLPISEKERASPPPEGDFN